jgi:hypothetical protein
VPSVSDNLNQTIAGYATALAKDSCNPQPSYTLDGKSVSRAEWRAGLEALIVELTKTVNALNPYCVVSRKAL